MERSISDLRQRQSLPLGAKVSMTQRRILEWVNEFGENGVYVSFSGGKDSTVLLHLVRQMFPDIEAVFVDTGLEYPEIRQFVRQHENATILRPKMVFKDVICKYGYPVISKTVSHGVEIARNNPEGNVMKRQFSDDYESKFALKAWKPIIKADFRISDKCCNNMKKYPAKKFEHERQKHPFTAQMADESLTRQKNWIQNGCNAFDMKRPISNPMSFWTEQDVLQYIKENNIEICSVYGDIIPEGGAADAV
jgi:3'-phosphoadenosine 5'-phosphosulfate sulfotransferase (PAPS reductase)/FAD synthetase